MWQGQNKYAWYSLAHNVLSMRLLSQQDMGHGVKPSSKHRADNSADSCEHQNYWYTFENRQPDMLVYNVGILLKMLHTCNCIFMQKHMSSLLCLSRQEAGILPLSLAQ